MIGLAEYTGAASVTHHYRYDVWGKPQGSVTEAVPNPIRFKARWWDEDTGLYDFRSRWYDPEIGRFISEDPIGLAGGINVYTFAGNNPVSGWDPFGLFDPDDGPCDDPDVVPENPEDCPELEPLDVTPLPDPFGGGDRFGDPIGPGPAPGPSKGSPGNTGGPSRASTPEPRYMDFNQCIIGNAILHYRGTIDVIETPITIQLREDLNSVTFSPGKWATNLGSIYGNARVQTGALQTIYRGAPYAGPNGAPIRGGKFIGGVVGKFAKGLAFVKVAWHAALFAGSELVAVGDCLTGG